MKLFFMKPSALKRIAPCSKMSVSNTVLSMLKMKKLVKLYPCLFDGNRFHEFANFQLHLRVKSLRLKLFVVINSNFF